MNKLLSGATVAMLLLGAAPVFAQDTAVTVSATANANLEARIVTAKERANQEITRRINQLNEMNTKVQAMKHVSATQKSTISATVQAEIASLTTLQAKIAADTDLATVRADIQALHQEYRIFALVIPQSRIMVAADRVLTTVPTYTTFATTLQTAITQAQSNGNDVTAVTASLAEMNAKIANATAQAQAAITAVAALVPDQGNETVRASNTAALKAASANIKTAVKDLQTARQNAASIAAALKGNANAKVTASYTVNGSTNITVNVGETLNYAWSSTNGVSATHSYTQDSTSCGVTGTGPFDLGTSSLGGTVSEVVTDCWAGHTYVMTFTVVGADGKTANAFATVKVNSLLQQ